MSRVQVKLVKSPVGRKPSHRETAQRLGLRKLHQTVTHERTAPIEGMIRTIGYMLEVKEVAE